MTRSQPKKLQQAIADERWGGVLVCVLVVLLLVGLMMAQAIQTLLVLRRDQTRRAELQQAQALLSLGETLVRMHWETVQPNAAGEPSATWLVDVRAGERAQIAASRQAAENGQEVLIEVSYPLGSEREIRASRSYSPAAIRPEAEGS